MASTALEEERYARSGLQNKGARRQNLNRIVAFIVVVTVSTAAFLYFFTNGMTNVYGDGVAHVNIARKVVDSPDDSLRQRYIQIGSPWLPVQTVLMLPLVTNDWMWRTGAAGSIVSMIAFIMLPWYSTVSQTVSTEERIAVLTPAMMGTQRFRR
jgi:hypothetical protein